MTSCTYRKVLPKSFNADHDLPKPILLVMASTYRKRFCSY